MSQSDILFEQAKSVIPGGVNSPGESIYWRGRQPYIFYPWRGVLSI